MSKKCLSIQSLYDACNKLRADSPSNEPYRFYMGGSGIPEHYLEQVIEYWKDSKVIVVDRWWNEYQHGKLIKERK